MTLELSPDVRSQLDGHLDAVEQALIANNHARERRRAIVDDLETQILDMLSKRSNPHTLTDLNEVLASLDPPAAYKDATGAAPMTAAPPATVAPLPRYSRAAIAGFICILVSLIPLALVFVFATYFASARPTKAYIDVPINKFERDPKTNELKQQTIQMVSPEPVRAKDMRLAVSFMLIALGPLALAGTALGWIAFTQIRKSHGMIQGKGLALFNGLFYPILAPPLLSIIA